MILLTPFFSQMKISFNFWKHVLAQSDMNHYIPKKVVFSVESVQEDLVGPIWVLSIAIKLVKQSIRQKNHLNFLENLLRTE